MNYLAIVTKHLKGLEEAYYGLKKPETQQKARDEIMAACSRMGVCVAPGVSGEGVVSMTVGRFIGDGRDMTVTCGDVPCKAVESGFPGVSTTTVNGVTTVYPHDWEGGERGPGAFSHEIEGDVNGSTGEFETVSTLPETTIAHEIPVEMIGGWPERAVVTLTGLAPNRRMLKGKIGDGRSVCVERGLGKPTSGEHLCRLVRAGQSPLFRMLSA